MGKIKLSSIAGTFFSEDRNELINQIATLETKKTCEYHSRAVIAPHAAYYYSGKLAYSGVNYLDREIRNLFVIAPSHKVPLTKTATCDYTHFQTPIGLIEVNGEIIKELNTEFGCDISNEVFDDEHAIEIQLPLIQSVLKGVKIIPILTSGNDIKTLVNIFERYYPDKSNGFLISTDLSHYLPVEKAERVDNITAQMIETKSVSNFRAGQACGAVGICALVQFATNHNYDLIRLGLAKSSDIEGEDKSRVVGYGSWALYEGSKNEFLNKYYKKAILNVCKSGIKTKGNAEFKAYPAVLDENGACFVTLERQGMLRGCIGSIIPYRPLIDDLVDNAYKSAYEDPRFEPIHPEELSELQIKVSLLSTPVQIEFENEDDLISKIVQGVDGVIIQDGAYQAVYLPSVWEQFGDKISFLRSLKQKAGLPPTHFSDNFEAFRFRAEYLQ